MENIQPLDRSFGLETECAIRFDRTETRFGKRTNCLEIYEEICEYLKQNSAAAPAHKNKLGCFFANGSAIWFERILPGRKEGLIEVCTPECRDPMELAANHAAMDRLLGSAVSQCTRDVGLLKNCIDPRGVAYGAQENYEVIGYDDEEARQWNKGIDRLKFAARVSMSMLAIMCLLPMFLFFYYPIFTFGLVAALYTLLCVLTRRLNSSADVLYNFIGLVLCPKAFLVSRFYHKMKIGRTYEKLKPFLISRGVWSGAGGIDIKSGRFFLGQKAKSRNTDWLTVSCTLQKPIFCLNYLFKELCRNLESPVERKSLRNQRQRLSLSVGDSNMSQEVNWPKVATTCLVLDAIEAGAIREFPKVGKPLQALKKINDDPSLQSSVATSRGAMTGIEIQQFSLNACRQYVESFEDPPQQALDVLKRWNEFLVKLKTDQNSLVGRVDWITKRQIMRSVVEKCDYQIPAQSMNTGDEFVEFGNRTVLQKADLKFHELGPEGYHQQLVDSGVVEALLDDEGIDRATRMPPTVKTAAQRCRYIREFGPEIEWIAWDEVKLVNRDSISLQHADE